MSRLTTRARLEAFKGGTVTYLSAHNKGWRRSGDSLLWTRALHALEFVYGPVNGTLRMQAAVAYARATLADGEPPVVAMRAACERFEVTRAGLARAVLRMKGASNG